MTFAREAGTIGPESPSGPRRACLLGLAILLTLAATGCATQGAGHHGHDDGSIGSSNRSAGNEHVVIRPNGVAPDQDGLPPSSDIPSDLINVPDAVPRDEPRSAFGNPTSYEVYGQKYVVLGNARGFKERGEASWYGKKFHGKLTSSGEPYDMFKMTAAHKTLPIPCYARVTNLGNGRSVVVRINDRGPFHSGRIIDLSYAAALKLGLIGQGSAPVELEVLTPGQTTPPPVMLADAGSRPTPSAIVPMPASPTRPSPPAPATLRIPAEPPRSEATLQMATTMQAETHTPSLPALEKAAASASLHAPLSPTFAADRPGTSPSAVTADARPVEAILPRQSGASVPVSMQSGTGTVMPVPAPPRWLQVGLFGDANNAAILREQLLRLGMDNVQLKSEVRGASYIHRVLVGPYADAGQIQITRERLAELHLDSLPVAE